MTTGVRERGLMGFVAAMTSVLTSTLNSAQTLVTMDLVSKLRKGMSSRQQVVTGSIAGLIIITAAALWAPQIQKFDSIVKYFQQLLSYLAPPVVAVFMAGLFWRRATASGAFAGLIAGLCISVSLVFGIHYTPMAYWHFLYVAPLVFAASLAIVVCVSLATAAPDAARVKTYVWHKSVFATESLE